MLCAFDEVMSRCILNHTIQERPAQQTPKDYLKVAAQMKKYEPTHTHYFQIHFHDVSTQVDIYKVMAMPAFLVNCVN